MAALNTNSIPPTAAATILSTTSTTITTTPKVAVDNDAQMINSDLIKDDPVSRKFGVSSPVKPLTTGIVKSEIIKGIYCSGTLLEMVQEAKLFHDCKHFVDMPLKMDPG